jgi:hypothetical protein
MMRVMRVISVIKVMKGFWDNDLITLTVHPQLTSPSS